MEIIDTHTHCWQDDLAPRVLELFRKADYPLASGFHYDGTVTGLIASMDKSGVSRSVILPVATKPTQVDTINMWAESLLESDRIIPFFSIHPETPDKRSVVERAAQAGFKGVKLHTLSQHFHPQEKRMWPIYEACMENDLVIVFHAGADLSCPVLDDRADFDEYFRLFPYERTVLAHLGGYQNLNLQPSPIPGRPGYIDLAYSGNFVCPDNLVEICRAHGTKHVLFATDGPWSGQEKDIAYVKNAGFTQEELEDIFEGNAKRLLGLD